MHANFQMDSLLEKASKPQQNLVPSPKMKMVPATYVPENPLPSYLNCPAPTQTLCNSMGSSFLFGCCPLTNAVCCPDLATCCPSGMECAKEGAMCAGNRSFMVRRSVLCNADPTRVKLILSAVCWVFDN